MKTKILAAGVAAVALAAAVAGSALADKAGEGPQVPLKADNFRLVDHTGFAQELSRLVDVKAIVLVTQVNGDKDSRRAAKVVEQIKANNPGVEFLMLNSSLKDDRAAMVAEAEAQGYTIPVMDDDLQLVGEQLGVSYAGEAFVLEPKTLKVLYHGPVDAAGASKKAKGYLAEALASVSAGKPVAVKEVAGKGAKIAFPERDRLAQHRAISYAADIAPILEAKCVVCHQEGGIGPFAMKDYATVKGFAPMIREAIRTDRMPPWHPDSPAGTFKHEASLSNDQIKKIVHWVEAGAPRGDGPDPLAAVERKAPEWPLGQPDLIVDIPAFKLPAAGEIAYQYPAAANPLTEGRWVKATTIMPGDYRGVHHILAGYMPKMPANGRAAIGGGWDNAYGEYAVGGESWTVPDKLGVYLPPNGAMGFQMHYTPYGKEAVDNSKMGFYFYPKGETPERIMRHYVISDNLIELPPNTDKHKEVAYTKFPKDALLHSVFLHTHYRGLAGKLDIVRANGSSETLINLPRYDFNWQRTYEFIKPVPVKAGDKLVATYLYDNSVRNAANPDPNDTVIWGDQSWEEMHYTSIYFEWLHETAAKPDDAIPEMRAGRMMGMLDDNLDEKIELAELKGRGAAMLKPRFAQLDVNKDGGIDATELQAAGGMFSAFGARPAAATGESQ
jgi:hypothetical protein